MAKLGLLGALGGVGQALQTFGGDIIKRREQALEWARKEAEYQRNRGDKMADTASAQQHAVALETMREGASAERTEAQIAARKEENQATREFRKSERVAGQSFTSSEHEKNRAAQRNLAKLRSTLQSANTAAEVRLRDQLQADDVHAVQYGAPDANGYAEVLVVTQSGEVRKTGQRVYRPKTETDDDTKL